MCETDVVVDRYIVSTGKCHYELLLKWLGTIGKGWLNVINYTSYFYNKIDHFMTT